MANLTKVVVSLDDGSTVEYDIAPAVVVPEVVSEVKVEESAGTEEVFTPEAPAAPAA
jgi:hypothetical protein